MSVHLGREALVILSGKVEVVKSPGLETSKLCNYIFFFSLEIEDEWWLREAIARKK